MLLVGGSMLLWGGPVTAACGGGGVDAACGGGGQCCN